MAARMRKGAIAPLQGSTARRRAFGALVMALVFTAPLAACGSSRSSTTSSGAEVKQTCQELEAILGDGPEPRADPVGYAQAQILPLREIRTSDKELHKAIDGLASAYHAFAAANGVGYWAKSAVTLAAQRVDAICPGAAT